METMYIPLSSIFIAFIINFLITPIIIRVAHKLKLYDSLNSRKIHTGLIPRLGGVGIFISLIITCCMVSFIAFLNSGKTMSYLISSRYLFLLAGILIIHLIGLLDDFIQQKPLVKLLFQIIAAGCVACGGFIFKEIPIPYIGRISLGFLAYPFTIFWIISITNAMNLVDGMDGLAGGITAFASLSMGIIALIQGQVTTAIIAFTLFGATAGFLLFNLPPAKIFMGDSGSLLIGFTLSILPLMGISAAASFATVLVPITLLLVPIMDTLAAIIRRIGDGRTILSPDREHIHHKLLDMGLSEKKILALIYCVCFYLSIIAITSVIMPKESNVYLILIVWIGSLMGYGFIHYLNTRKKVISIEEDARKKNSA
ncbi:MAG: undecaprenyl/decaprenyl-phosphate alpha-N-acetylglucosaminyl 1-phosphate transferase [Spirochaetales bacterium]|nr:undecaprenyl/decaprenyl-phosphate alpha-N-acetylglucosaminyl 1-phosphate transferase [Spirochaetales bacterium]